MFHLTRMDPPVGLGLRTHPYVPLVVEKVSEKGKVKVFFAALFDDVLSIHFVRFGGYSMLTAIALAAPLEG